MPKVSKGPKPPEATARVAVVGAGIVSPLGFGSQETLASLHQGKDCVSRVSRFSVENCRCTTAGQVSDERLVGVGQPHFRPERLHRVAQMLMVALGETLTQAPGFQPELAVTGTTSGGMTFGEEYYRAMTETRTSRRGLPSLIANYVPQKAMIDALRAFNLSAPCQIIANACASGTNAIGHAFECIRSGRYAQVLTGGYDALSELVFVGFDSLQALTPERCRPFDHERSGLVLGEGAAILLLENWDRAKAHGRKILAEIIGYGISTDSYHLTQPDPSGWGPRRAMEAALQDAGLSAGEVDYVNAHGTATTFNDATEGRAIADLFNGVPVSSSKSMMGHALGAAGAIEAVITLLALQDGFLPPNINFRSLDPGLTLNIVTNPVRLPGLTTVLSNSFGFGGTNASVILRTVTR